jgi:hypothetical protein
MVAVGYLKRDEALFAARLAAVLKNTRGDRESAQSA